MLVWKALPQSALLIQPGGPKKGCLESVLSWSAGKAAPKGFRLSDMSGWQPKGHSMGLRGLFVLHTPLAPGSFLGPSQAALLALVHFALADTGEG